MTPVYFKKQNHRPSLAVLLPLSLSMILLLLSACSGGAAISAPTGLLTPGVLTVGSDTTYPPQEYIDPKTNKAAGFDIDLITAMAQRMGLKVNIVPAKFDSLMDGLAARHFDVVISAVSVTPDRQKQADFVPYFNAGESLLVQAGNPKHITSTDDLCGLAVGVQQGTIDQGVLQSSSDNCLEQDKPAITIIALEDQTAVIQLLSTGRAVATYQDSPVTDYFSKQHPDQYAVAGSVFAPGPEGIAVRKNDSSMLNAIQSAYQQVKSAGTYHQLILKWGLNNEELNGG